ncbi:hypothetical protein HispidOSU_012343 [Sigmodon hispidus]
MTPLLPAAASRQLQPCNPEPCYDPEPHPPYRKSPVEKVLLAGDAIRKPQTRNETLLGGGLEAGPDGRPAHAH